MNNKDVDILITNRMNNMYDNTTHITKRRRASSHRLARQLGYPNYCDMIMESEAYNRHSFHINNTPVSNPNTLDNS